MPAHRLPVDAQFPRNPPVGPACAAKVVIECCKLTLSSFIALMCSLGCPIRNASLKVAYFEVPIPGRFSLPADTQVDDEQGGDEGGQHPGDVAEEAKADGQ